MKSNTKLKKRSVDYRNIKIVNAKLDAHNDIMNTAAESKIVISKDYLLDIKAVLEARNEL